MLNNDSELQSIQGRENNDFEHQLEFKFDLIYKRLPLLSKLRFIRQSLLKKILTWK